MIFGRYSEHGRKKMKAPSQKSHDELRTALDACIADCGKLKEHNDDLSNQNRELRGSKRISPEEEAEFTRLRAEHLMALEEQNKLALWLRDNKSRQIAAGKHMGMNLSEVCIMYMAQTVKVVD